MKRVIVAAVTLLSVLGIVLAPTPANAAPSDVCRDGSWPEVQVVNDPLVPAYLGVEYRLPDGVAQHATLCFKDRTGVTNTGGHIHVAVVQAWEAAYITCSGDLPAVVALNCIALADVNTTDHNSGPGTTLEGFINVQTITVSIPLTGVEAGQPFTNTITTMAVGHTGPCMWFLGQQLMPGCNATAAEAHVEPNDVVPATGGSGIPVCVGIFVGSSCIGTWVTVTTNPTVAVGTDGDQTVGFTVLGIGTGENLGYTCIGATAPC